MKERPDITQLLKASSGDPQSAEALYEAVYDQLRVMAASRLQSERAGHTLQPTALAHEAYLKLIDQNRVDWQNRGQFFSIAGRALRRILVDYARHRNRDKRGGGAPHVPLEEALHIPGMEIDFDLVALDAALTRLKAEDPAKCSVVEMRFFAGLTNDEVAEVLGVTTRTVERHWQFARAWLYNQLTEDRE